MLVSAERGKVRLISCEIIFQEFQLIGYMITIPQRQTDRQTDRLIRDRQLATAIPRSAQHCAVLPCAEAGMDTGRVDPWVGSGHNFTQI